MRRPLTAGTSNIALRPDRVIAWSIMPDSNTVPMGWGAATTGPGWYDVESLASGQKYMVWMTDKGGMQRSSGVVANPCKITPLNFRV